MRTDALTVTELRAQLRRQVMRAVTAEQKRQILELAGDLPRLWAASTTTPRDRKRILRLLVRERHLAAQRRPQEHDNREADYVWHDKMAAI